MTQTKMLVAIAATALAIAAAAHADEKTVSYNVAPGVCSPPIAVPANNKPVTVSGTQIAAQRVGAGQVTLMRSTQTPSLIWAGVDYYQGVERGYALINDTGTLIMVLDFAGYVTLKTAPSTHVQVCSSTISPATFAGYVTFFY